MHMKSQIWEKKVKNKTIKPRLPQKPNPKTRKQKTIEIHVLNNTRLLLVPSMDQKNNFCNL
jgi:hypothetical protein